MIKIKIYNPVAGKNRISFMGFLMLKDALKDYSIEITESDDFDYMFVGMQDFYDKNRSIEESTEWGLENLDKITEGGDYFLFDGQDSTSIMGAYEVFTQSNATYLFKNQLHQDKDNYNLPKAFNKWFMGSGSDLDLSYNIPVDIWNRIKLTGWNFMSNIPIIILGEI